LIKTLGMIKRFIYNVVILSALFCFGCKTQPKNDSIKSGNASVLPEEDKEQIVAANPLIVSFFSRGAGIDYTAYKYLLMAINEHNATYKTKLVFNSASWGREGEKDLCFPKQSTPKFDDFVSSVKTTLDSNRNVHLYFNEVCREGK
jgi:hypothetical protein